ncbi:hypothetical protein SD80_012390 [Scytonema tolypothrichoides VB-61278]|nr:hypothetical protein SD80_012390 [Scytonema tolypothrichoides VB-61278]
MTTNGNGKRKKGQSPSAKDLGALSLADIPVEEPAALADTNATENGQQKQPDNNVIADTPLEPHQAVSDIQPNEETPLENVPDPSQPLEQPSQAITDENPEELLRAARNSAGTSEASDQESTTDTTNDNVSTPPQKEQKGEIAPRSTSQVVGSATAKAAQNLVKANQKAAQERLQTGLREGYEDAKDFRKGYQLGLLKGVTDAKQKDSTEFSQQLEKLRQHTDIEGGQDIDQILGKMGLSLETEQTGQENKEETPLDIFSRLVDSSLPTDDETLNILDLAAQSTPLDPTRRASSPG